MSAGAATLGLVLSLSKDEAAARPLDASSLRQAQDEAVLALAPRLMP